MISRAWIGPELEGYDIGVKTLFIEGLNIDGNHAIDLVKEHLKEIRRVYLGAGGKGIVSISNALDFFVFCKSNKIKVVAEILLDNYNQCDEVILKNVTTILTASGNKSNYINYFKVDNSRRVYVYKLLDGISNSLDTLKEGLYEQDKLIYSVKESL